MHNSNQSSYQSAPSCATEPEQPQGKRPLAVWLLMFVLAVITIFIASDTTISLPLPSGRSGSIDDPILVDAALRLAIAYLCFGGIIGILKRRRWARRSGVIFIFVLMVLIFFRPHTSPGYDDPQPLRVFATLILTPLLMPFWAYRFGLSDKAQRYFAG